MNLAYLNQSDPPFITVWKRKEAEYVFCIDESGNHDLVNIDPNWPILSLFGAMFSYESFKQLKKEMHDLKVHLWPPNGTFQYKCKGSLETRQVCFHSREMRRMTGPFSKTVLNDSQRELMDRVIWDDIISSMSWWGINCIIDKRRLCWQYSNPEHPYILAVKFMFERLVMTVKQPVIVIFECRGKEEDQFLWDAVKDIFINGTGYIKNYEFMQRIAKVGWYPKFDKAGRVVCGLEIADLCAYALGSEYFRGENPYANKVNPKLLGYPNAVNGRGKKIFP